MEPRTEETLQLPRASQDYVILMLNFQSKIFQSFFLSFYSQTNKNAIIIIIINPNKDSACCHVLSVVWPGGYLQAGRRLKLRLLAAAGVSELQSLLTQRNKGVMIHDQEHAKSKQEKWYKIEIITIHVQHAGLIFLMQIFVFFYIIEQAIKVMRFFFSAPRMS